MAGNAEHVAAIMHDLVQEAPVLAQHRTVFGLHKYTRNRLTAAATHISHGMGNAFAWRSIPAVAPVMRPRD